MLQLPLILVYLSLSNGLLPLETYQLQDKVQKLQMPGSLTSLSLDIRHEVDDPWIRDLSEAHSGTDLVNATDYDIGQFDHIYYRETNEAYIHYNENAPLKYGISILFRFLVELLRIVKKLSDVSGQIPFFKIDVYGQAYDHALEQLKPNRKLSPLQMSLPVKEVISVYTNILYGSAELQTCDKSWTNWHCVVVYLASVIDTIDCPDVWYHTLVQLALEMHPSSVVHTIFDLQQLELPSIEFMFNYTLGLIVATKEQPRDLLTSRAVFYSMVLHLQEDGLLDFVF